MRRMIDLKRWTLHDENHEMWFCINIQIGVLKITIKIGDRQRLKLIEFLSGAKHQEEVYLQVDDWYCPEIKVKGRYSDITMDMLNVRKVEE